MGWCLCLRHVFTRRNHLSPSQVKGTDYSASVEWQDLPREGCAVTTFLVTARFSAVEKKDLSAAMLEEALFDALFQVR